MSLKIAAVSAGRWTSLTTIIIASAQAVQLVIVSRLLSVSDFGLAALTIMILGFAMVVSDLGINKLLIQKQADIIPEIRTSLYLFEIGFSFVVWISIWISLPSLVEFYGEPRLELLIRHGSFLILVIPIGRQFYFLMVRDLRFKELAVTEIVGTIVGLAVTILAAILNQGAYAPVWGYVGNMSVQYLLFAFIGWRNFPLTRRLKARGLWPYFKFGFYASLDELAYYISSNADYLIIGYYLSANKLGFYVLAYQLTAFPAQKLGTILTDVTFAVFAKRQDDNAVLRRGYIEVSQLLGVVALPLLGGLLITAPLMVQVVFGEAWNESISLVQFLTVVGLVKMLTIPVGPLLYAKGRADVALLEKSSFTLIVILVFLFVVKLGLPAIAISFAVVSCFRAACMLGLMKWAIDLKVSTYLVSMKAALLATIWMCIGAYCVIAQSIVDVRSVDRLLAAIVIGAIIYVTYILVMDRPFIVDFLKLLTRKA